MIPDRHLSQYVPYILRDVEEFKAIMAAGQAAFDAVDDGTHVGVWRAMERAIKDAFLLTEPIRDENGDIIYDEYDENGKGVPGKERVKVLTTEFGLSRWEEMLNIVPPAQSGDDYDRWLKQRLDIILARIRGDAPYTYANLVNHLLKTLCKNREDYRVELSVYNVDGWTSTPYSIRFTLALGNEAVFAAVNAMLRRVVPVNLKFESTMMYNRHKDYRPYYHSTLNHYTHVDLRTRKWGENELINVQEGVNNE